jgi:pyridine nucleotide-disulfide oxidoreductase family protein
MKRLVLLGGGHAHVHVLKAFAAAKPADTAVTLISPYARQVYSGMLPGWISGHYAEDECMIPLTPLAGKADADFITARATVLDVGRQTVTLEGGKTIEYDWLSIDTGPYPTIDAIEGAREHALPVRPIEGFVAGLRSALQKHFRAAEVRVAIVGAGAGGVELAFAVREALKTHPSATVLLVAATDTVLPDHPPNVQQRVSDELRASGVAVLRGALVRRVLAGRVELTNAHVVEADVIVLATGTRAAPWLGTTALAKDAAGYIATNAYLQSTSHPNVFAAGDCATQLETPRPKSGVFAVRAGPPLATNLTRALAGQPLQAYRPQRWSLYLLSCGRKHAVASWGTFSWQGDWVWRWKNSIDHGFIRKYTA